MENTQQTNSHIGTITEDFRSENNKENNLSDGDMKDLYMLFKRLELLQQYKLEEILKRSIHETEELLEITEMDRAALRHKALSKNSIIY